MSHWRYIERGIPCPRRPTHDWQARRLQVSEISCREGVGVCVRLMVSSVVQYQVIEPDNVTFNANFRGCNTSTDKPLYSAQLLQRRTRKNLWSALCTGSKGSKARCTST
jgi:hypothetical protein